LDRPEQPDQGSEVDHVSSKCELEVVVRGDELVEQTEPDDRNDGAEKRIPQAMVSPRRFGDQSRKKEHHDDEAQGAGLDPDPEDLVVRDVVPEDPDLRQIPLNLERLAKTDTPRIVTNRETQVLLLHNAIGVGRVVRVEQLEGPIDGAPKR